MTTTSYSELEMAGRRQLQSFHFQAWWGSRHGEAWNSVGTCIPAPLRHSLMMRETGVASHQLLHSFSSRLACYLLPSIPTLLF